MSTSASKLNGRSRDVIDSPSSSSSLGSTIGSSSSAPTSSSILVPPMSSSTSAPTPTRFGFELQVQVEIHVEEVVIRRTTTGPEPARRSSIGSSATAPSSRRSSRTSLEPGPRASAMSKIGSKVSLSNSPLASASARALGFRSCEGI